MMQSTVQRFLGVGAIAMTIALTLVACNSGTPQPTSSPSPVSSASPTSSPTTSPTTSPSPTPSTEPLKSTTQSKPTASPEPTKTEPTKTEPTKVAAAGTVPVKVYRMDAACNTLVPKLEDLPKEKTLEAAIGSVISRNNNADFTVSDYRVTQTGSKATIVLRLPPSAKRLFTSMSTCEQMSLFGALRETVVGRSEWKIREVEFSDGKEEIVF